MANPDETIELTFEDFWKDVEDYAKQQGLPVHYVEEEFIIDGEFIVIEFD